MLRKVGKLSLERETSERTNNRPLLSPETGKADKNESMLRLESFTNMTLLVLKNEYSIACPITRPSR